MYTENIEKIERERERERQKEIFVCSPDSAGVLNRYLVIRDKEK